MLINRRGRKCDLHAGENTIQQEELVSSAYAGYQTKIERQTDCHIETLRKDNTRDLRALHFKHSMTETCIQLLEPDRNQLDCRRTFCDGD